MGAPVPPARPSRALVPAAVAVVVLSVLGLVLLVRGPGVDVGDCVTAGDREVVVVGCDDPAATFQVVGVLDDVPAVDSQPACLAVFPRTTASYSDGGLSREPSRVLCLVAA
ncbi:hypothetical protein SAMN03159343_3483 [Klenkia marina]|uniref:Uncharacterized protein n=1 Tax=Klenkia marina TaxID=1960309 RepID=A0A1G4YTK3_9ACTN|nr:hypothetical protein [Klenkia marina]SCX56701.1 hypothetical protein SAMN03159343_3483 [Klenkia marina]